MRLPPFYPGEQWLVVATADSCQPRNDLRPIALGVHVRLEPVSEGLSSIDVRIGDTVLCVGRTRRSELLLDPANDRYVLLTPRGLLAAKPTEPAERYHQVVQLGHDRTVVAATWARLRRLNRDD